jgi:hypothetical protein
MDAGGDEGSGAELGEEGEDACAPGEKHVDADHEQDRRVAPGELHVGFECSRAGGRELATQRGEGYTGCNSWTSFVTASI